jgi:hypothetical protein
MVRLAGAFGQIRRQIRTISFSQYGEDVLLYALFSPAPSGFYVDVGAHHPWNLSNTYKLYLRGWSGVTIEPNPDAAPLFTRHRPLTFHKFAQPALNSFDAEQSDRMTQEVIQRISVECLPLQEVVDLRARDRSIDLLSVDCEGFDLDVLSSLDWTRVRPTAVIVEDFEQFISNKDGTPS